MKPVPCTVWLSALSLIALSLIASGLLPTPARAHKVIASVYASGSTIEGEIGFSNGDMAADIAVEVYDDAGNRMGQTRTDDDGFFVFTPIKSVPHVFRANLGAGHIAEARLEGDDLPTIADVPPAAGVISSAKAATNTATSVAEPADSIVFTKQQRLLIAEAVRTEVRPLRREIAAYREKNDLQTILGGIGYIVGLFGLWFFLAARRQRAANAAEKGA